MTSLVPPPMSGQRSSSTVSTASMYSVSEGEGASPQQGRESNSSTTYQYRVEKRQTIFVKSNCPPHHWDETTRLGIGRQLSSAPEEVSTTIVQPSPVERRAHSWCEEIHAEAPELLSNYPLSRAPSRSLSSSPVHLSPHEIVSKPLMCMPGLRVSPNSSPGISYIPSNTSSATSSKPQKPPSPSRRRHIRSRIYFYNREDLYYGFTNFSDHEVTYKGKVYPTSEHLFQSFKVWHEVIQQVIEHLHGIFSVPRPQTHVGRAHTTLFRQTECRAFRSSTLPARGPARLERCQHTEGD